MAAAQAAYAPDTLRPDEQGTQTFLDINPGFSGVLPDELGGQMSPEMSVQPSEAGSLAAPLQQNSSTPGKSFGKTSRGMLKRQVDGPLSYAQTLAGVARPKVQDPNASQREDTNAAPDVLPHQRTTPLSSSAGALLSAAAVAPSSHGSSDSSHRSSARRTRPAPFVLQRRAPTASAPLPRQTDSVVQLPSASKPVFVSPRSGRGPRESEEDQVSTGEHTPMQRVLSSNQSSPRSVHKGGAADAAAWVEFGRVQQMSELARRAKGMPQSPRKPLPVSPRSLGPQPPQMAARSPTSNLPAPQLGSVETWYGRWASSQVHERRETDDDIVQEGKFGKELKYVVYSNSLYEMEAEPLAFPRTETGTGPSLAFD